MVYLNEDGPFPSGYPSDQELETTDVLLSYNDEMEVTYDVQIETTMDRYFGSAEENGPNPPNLCTLWYFQLQIDNYNGEKPLYVRYKHLNNNDYVYPIGALVYPISNYNF
ncbi:MAG TPA: hypothetical protein DCE41_02480 [Cytophagales bacterium]|nr:hypothetical protein [Cytophagales bacterium]HAA22192.1 hypothetical protein [Cytophagales bacterium]HAP63342.1 hypothetical protein [Cytophagales bacterium]